MTHKTDPFTNSIRFGLAGFACVIGSIESSFLNSIANSVYSDWDRRAELIERYASASKTPNYFRSVAENMEKELRREIQDYDDSCWRFIPQNNIKKLVSQLDNNRV